MPYRIAGIDVHKKMLAVVVSDVEVYGEFQFEPLGECTREAGEGLRDSMRAVTKMPEALACVRYGTFCIPTIRYRRNSEHPNGEPSASKQHLVHPQCFAEQR